MAANCDNSLLSSCYMRKFLHAQQRLSDEFCHLASHHLCRIHDNHLQMEEVVGDQARIGLDFICYIST
jgi:hypothetical protein